MTGANGAATTRVRFDASGVRFVVTGAAGLVGRALVARLAEVGAEVTALDRTADVLRDASEEWPSRVATVIADLSDAEAVAGLADHPGVRNADVLINNAAVTHLTTPLLDTTVADLDAISNVNVRATTLLSQIVVRRWRDDCRSGCIVNMSSPGATRAHDNQAAYDGSKGAIEALTRAMAVEWGALGVRVNALAPARVQRERQPVTDAPLGWTSTGRDIADAALWLVSDAAAVVTGQVIALDGGLLARLRPGGLDSTEGAEAAPTRKVNAL